MLQLKKKLNNNKSKKKNSQKFHNKATQINYLDQVAIKTLKIKSKISKIGNQTIKKKKKKKSIIIRNKKKEKIIAITITIEDITLWGAKKEDQEPRGETKIK